MSGSFINVLPTAGNPHAALFILIMFYHFENRVIFASVDVGISSFDLGSFENRLEELTKLHEEKSDKCLHASQKYLTELKSYLANVLNCNKDVSI
jgi:hypothetical protein